MDDHQPSQKRSPRTTKVIRTASQQIDIDRTHPEKGQHNGHKVDGSLGAPTVPPDPTAPTLRLSLPPNHPATGDPVISGTVQVGAELTALTDGIMDEDELDDVFAYQWVRVDADGTSNEEDKTRRRTSTRDEGNARRAAARWHERRSSRRATGDRQGPGGPLRATHRRPGCRDARTAGARRTHGSRGWDPRG